MSKIATAVGAAMEIRGAEPRSMASRSDSLLDLVVKQALFDVLAFVDGKKYRTANLHQFATRGIHAGTEHLLDQRELLVALGAGPAAMSGAIDKRPARFLRSVGSERSMKRETLRAHVLALLRSRAVPNSHAVQGWAFAMCHAAALAVANAANDEDLEILQTREAPNCSTVDEFRTIARAWLFETAEQDLTDASARHERGDARASVEVFLHYATLELLLLMARDGHAWATLKHLTEVAYPEFDKFGDPGDL